VTRLAVVAFSDQQKESSEGVAVWEMKKEATMGLGSVIS